MQFVLTVPQSDETADTLARLQELKHGPIALIDDRFLKCTTSETIGFTKKPRVIISLGITC